MWVLTLLGGGKAAGQQEAIYLTSGDISIGRPLKKGSTVGKANILIFNEQSVSTIHATLLAEAAAQDGPFEHGDLNITGAAHKTVRCKTSHKMKLPVGQLDLL
jgi:hypothetical protein